MDEQRKIMIVEGVIKNTATIAALNREMLLQV